jgi:phage tail sheath gpL-like
MIGPSTRAYATGASIENVNFKAGGTALPRKVVVIGTVDPDLEDGLTEGALEPVTNAAQAGGRYGRGFNLAKRIAWLAQEYSGVIYAIPTFEATATPSAGSVTFSGEVTTSGTLHFYVGGEKVLNINLAVGDDGEAVVDKIVVACGRMYDLPVTVAKDGTTKEKLVVTAKSGLTGWDFSLGFNYGFNEKFPLGLGEPSITAMTGGAGTIDIETALESLGTEDMANDRQFTAVLIPSSITDTTNLDALSTYNGVGNEKVGCYANTVSKPLRSLIGDNTAGSGGLSALLALGEDRKETDRTTGVIAVPGSPNHPCHIAANVLGVAERIASQIPGAPYMEIPLANIIGGSMEDNWCKNLDDRDNAKQNGVGSTYVNGGSVMISDVVTFYHSDNIPAASNGYAEFCNLPLVQNFLNDVRVNFHSTKWIGCSVVADKLMVTDVTARRKARDTGDVMDDLIGLLKSWEAKSYIWSAAWSIAQIKQSGFISLRALSNGYDITLPVLLRVIPNVIDTAIQFDASVAIAL